MRKVRSVLFIVCFCVLCGCSVTDRFVSDRVAEALPEYAPNREITGEYDVSLAAKCVNGVFVGTQEDGVRIWKGIPYAKQPEGELRFCTPQAPDASDRVFEAFHFMKSGMQSVDLDEEASLYEQGEDCLGLNIWTSVTGTETAKPVFVFIHGGGWMAGGTSDPLYNGFCFAKNNPEILVVTVDYRLGMLGQIDLSSFPDGKNYPDSCVLCLLDIVQSLRWIRENIAAFGGDPENITICGESAGGGAVSMLCVMPEAKGLFSKAIPMSGSVAQFSELSETSAQVSALREAFGCETVEDLKQIPFEDLRKWWSFNLGDIYHHPVRGNSVIESDPLDAWSRGDSSDIVILQGNTAEEFRYYLCVFADIDELFDAACEGVTEDILQNGNEEFRKAYASYEETLHRLGYTGKEVYYRFMDDHAFNAGNIYQAEMHAKNGGKGYFYTFDKSYDGEYSKLGAAHAVDCSYLFGNFSEWVFGTPEAVKLSLRFQQMISNFCKTGDPSVDGLSWPQYNGQSRFRMMIGDNTHVEENFEKERVDAVMQMMDLSDRFRFTGNESTVIKCAEKLNPEAVKEYKRIRSSFQK